MEKINRRNTTPTSSSATDDALRALVRMLARQAAPPILPIRPNTKRRSMTKSDEVTEPDLLTFLRLRRQA